MHTIHGDRLLVATHRHDAQLTACELRSALLTPPRFGSPCVADVVGRCSADGGLIDIGGGLYQRSHPCSVDERWFVTTLADADVCALATSCPLGIPADAIDVVVRSDRELGAAVGLTASPGFGCRLDEAAFWLNRRASSASSSATCSRLRRGHDECVLSRSDHPRKSCARAGMSALPHYFAD